MSARTLLVVFRRTPIIDTQVDAIPMQGYTLFWPDGRPVSVGLNAFCAHGQKLLGLGKHLRGCEEKLVRVDCHPLTHREADLVRVRGYRVRRFCLIRQGSVGRLHFLDGTPTSTTFELDRDEHDVLAWIGLSQLADGEQQWVDLAAVAVEAEVSCAGMPAVATSSHNPVNCF